MPGKMKTERSMDHTVVWDLLPSKQIGENKKLHQSLFFTVRLLFPKVLSHNLQATFTILICFYVSSIFIIDISPEINTDLYIDMYTVSLLKTRRVPLFVNMRWKC